MGAGPEFPGAGPRRRPPPNPGLGRPRRRRARSARSGLRGAPAAGAAPVQ